MTENNASFCINLYLYNHILLMLEDIQLSPDEATQLSDDIIYVLILSVPKLHSVETTHVGSIGLTGGQENDQWANDVRPNMTHATFVAG